MELTLVILVIFVALVFTYTNGFHDTANSIATVVGTKVLTPRQAILLAAVTNLIGAFFGLAVAKTISGGIVDQSFMNQHNTQVVLVCTLVAAIFWNLLTWWFGMPSSSSHALIGSLVGATLAAAVAVNAISPMEKGVWETSVKWEEIKDKKVNKLVDPVAEDEPLVTALKSQSNWQTNGTHKVMHPTEKKEVEVTMKSGKPVVDKDGKSVPAPPDVLEELKKKPGWEAQGGCTVSMPVPAYFVVFDGRIQKVTTEVKKGEDKSGIKNKVVIPMVVSPLVGFGAGFLVMGLLYVGLRSWRPVSVNRVFGKAQLASSAYMGFSHGMNDATKCMGIITLALVAASTKDATGHSLFENLPSWLMWLRTSAGSDPYEMAIGAKIMSMLPSWLQFGYMPDPITDTTSQGVPNWVVVVCALTMGLGTAAGGWKIIKTMGHKMVKLQPVHGFAAETTAASVLAVTANLGMPVSTTHAITTSIMGVGCAKRFSALKLGVVERILWAWIMTLPATAGVAYGLVWLITKFGWVTWTPGS
ncbi:MAG TPA: inorganic phosphate transporter [Verrucomicrobiales bacterium]|nr:inorganic phosphate transporter [Verrucomicrobiales bacterium]